MNWLAFDIGTTNTKAALISSEGRVLRSAYRAYETQSGDGGVVEQHAQDWWTAVIGAAQELQATEAEAIALTGQMQDAILVDTHAEPVGPVILYSDTRARAEAEDVNQILGTERLSQLTGTVQDASSLWAKLLWLRRHEPDSLDRAACLLLGAADFVALKLTGNAVSDTTTASTTGLLNLASREFMGADDFARLDLAMVPRLLPTVKPGGALAGKLTADAAQVLGLRGGLPVYHGPGDAGATTLGVGSGEPGQVYGYIGTSGWVAFSSAQQISVDARIFRLAHPRADRLIYIAPLQTAGGNLEWLRELFGSDTFEALISEAVSRPPTNLLYLPYLNGERSPFSDPLARGAYIGLNAQHTRADLCRAVLEGVVFAYRHAMDALISEPVAGLMLTGGGTRSLLWCQLFSDIAQIPVAIAADAENVGVRGAVLAAQVLAQQLDSYATPGFFPVSAILQPDRRHKNHYNQQYQLFRAAYPALKPIFIAMA